MQKNRNARVGFALPTVLIASVVMLTVLTVSVSSVVSVRTAILSQYYEQVAKTAGEAGVAYAKACLAKNGNVPLWTDSKPLRPSTDCAGNETIGSTSFSALVVAGGGSGGGSTAGGGGGGGVVEALDFVLNTGSYTVAVGGGGAVPGNQAIGRSGANSTFNGLVAIGGGGGSYSSGGSASANGLNGGSGGGGQVYHGPRNPGNGTTDQGFNGGSITGAAAGSTTGGGGAGGPGSNNSAVNGGGSGGPGALSSLSGLPTYYGGGGGGGAASDACGALPRSSGGSGGGGAGGDVGSAGQQSTGGGGGGGWCYATGNGGAGGSGVVIIRYPNNGSIVATGGQEVYTADSYKIHKFTNVGNSTFTLSSVTPSSCPTDPRCSVMINGNLRSSFSVARPTLNGDGRAVAIPNSGYVELLRESTGQVWRTYRQPNVQAAVVPDLCSGAATSSLGWSRSVEPAAQNPLPGITTARGISQVDGALPAGKMYFRKDFPVVADGAYSVVVSTPTAGDKVDIYVDGVWRVAAQGAVATAPITLTAGCHTITAMLNNQTAVSRPSQFTAAIQRDSASSPIVATDSEWRVSAGRAVHYSESEFDADPAVWLPVGSYGVAQTSNASWQNAQSDRFTQIISPTTTGCPTLCPPTASMYLRENKDFVLAANTEVLVSALCDDNCAVYIDGQEVLAGAPWSSIGQQTLILTEGVHRVGVMLKNTGSAANPAGAAVSVTVKTAAGSLPAGTVLSRTDRTWTAANISTAGITSSGDIFSFEKSFRPSPDEISRATTFDLLVIGGGGGGGRNAAGGGGGGGFIYRPDEDLTIGTYNVTIGAGGAGAVDTSTAASNGASSSFGSYVAGGGGGGASRDNGSGGVSGASGGGGAGTTSGGTNPSLRHLGGNGNSTQGFNGGNGTPADASFDSKGGGGGGAGGVGSAGVAAAGGNGAPGFTTFMTGTRLGFAGGGGGSNTAGYGTSGFGTDGGTGGNGSAGAANTGGGAGGGAGNGGSGVVIVRVKTGSATITTTGSPAITSNVVIGDTSYTIYRFNANGSFTVVSIN